MVAQLVKRSLDYHGHETLTAAHGTCPGSDELELSSPNNGRPE